MKPFYLFVATIILAVGMTACGGKNKSGNATTETDQLPWYENMEALQKDLDAAIADAKQLDSSKIVNDLMPIKKGTPGEEWIEEDGHDMVLLITLVDSSRLKKFFGQEGTYKIDRELGTWASIPAEWARHKQKFEGLDSIAAHMRMLQLYGLSPDCTYNIMVSFYADVKGIFRPAHTPDITTTTAGLEFPDYANENYKVGDTNFREWYRYSVASAFEDDTPLPWTQLGYTYDWHQGAPRQGLSEYIVVDQTLVKVKSFETEWSFLQHL